MPAYKCEKHGLQIAAVFCEHAAAAVDERRGCAVYLQRGDWGWCTLCDACVRRADLADVVNSAGSLVCEECIIDWAERTGSDYVARCQDPKPEFPTG